MTTPATPASGPRPSDLMWERAALEMAPEKTLARVTANARNVVATVGVVGILLTGLGLVSALVLETHWILLAAALASSVLASVAVTIALFTQISRNSKVATGNLIEVEAWYRTEINRKRGSAWASIALFLAALIATGTTIVGGVVAVNEARTGPTVANRLTLSVTSNGDGTSTVSLGGSIDGVPDGATVKVRIDDRGDTVIRLSIRPDSGGVARALADAEARGTPQVVGSVVVFAQGADPVRLTIPGP